MIKNGENNMDRKRFIEAEILKSAESGRGIILAITLRKNLSTGYLQLRNNLLLSITEGPRLTYIENIKKTADVPHARIKIQLSIEGRGILSQTNRKMHA